MERTEVSFQGRTLEFLRQQNLVVGTGAAGFNAAVSLVKNGCEDVVIFSEDRNYGTSRNGGSDKQTYYKISTSGDTGDSIRQMAETLFAGQSMDGDIALVEAALSLRSFFHLVDIGVPFPYNAYGEYVGYKTDHDPNERGTSAGPLTSRYMTEALEKESMRLGIPILDGYQVVELLTDPEKKRVFGVLALKFKDNDGKMVTESPVLSVISANNVIYATGGEAGMYETSVYPVSQMGGMGPAFRAGVPGKNLTESQYGISSIKFRWNLSGTYQQVLPRYISVAQDGSDEQELLNFFFPDAETLLSAEFLKGYQWPFDPRKVMNYGSSLIDILVYQETVLRGRRVFMDYRRNPSAAEKDGALVSSLLDQEAYTYLANSGALRDTPFERLQAMNPESIQLYRSHGIDLEKEPVEIAVCAQHNNGGLAANCWWESPLRHFFPVGEVNGSHGVYRPGGSALNSGQCGGLRAAQYIAHKYLEEAKDWEQIKALCGNEIQAVIEMAERVLRRTSQTSEQGQMNQEDRIFRYSAERKQLGRRMSRYGAFIRSAEGVQSALKDLKEQMRILKREKVDDPQQLRFYFRTRDLLTSQMMYLMAIEDYIKQGGTSRGSYLIKDSSGQKPLDSLGEDFRFRSENIGFEEKIQEVTMTNERLKVSWRNIHPIPDADLWFEQVWKDFREGREYNGHVD